MTPAGTRRWAGWTTRESRRPPGPTTSSSTCPGPPAHPAARGLPGLGRPAGGRGRSCAVALVQLARQWPRVREEQPDLFVRRVVYREAVASWRKRPPLEVAAPAGLRRRSRRRPVGRRGRRPPSRAAGGPRRRDPAATRRRGAALVRGAHRGRGGRRARLRCRTRCAARQRWPWPPCALPCPAPTSARAVGDEHGPA